MTSIVVKYSKLLTLNLPFIIEQNIKEIIQTFNVLKFQLFEH